jgi:hypothetical protein
MGRLDPFLFLNHHGPQVYPPGNEGLPFGPHPHRGFETVTFILEGDLTHKDSSGAHSVIRTGGVQWMTAGRGLIHAEVSSEAFKQTGGPLELLQLWVNLPSRHKMTDPAYTGLQAEAIPVAGTTDGKAQVQAVSGNWFGVQGPVRPLTDVHLGLVTFAEGGRLDLDVPLTQTIFLYVVRGALEVNGTRVPRLHLVEFGNDDPALHLQAPEPAMILFGYGTPFGEPVVANGPFVMNTQEEIAAAYTDYRSGRFGSARSFL